MLVFSTAVHAAPAIQINSPQNTIYFVNKIPVNVTSNETVDFYVKGFTRDINLAKNSTNFESSLYGKTGFYTFTIYANNSNGLAVASVNYTINKSNPVNITSGGFLTASNTDYVLANNITGTIFWFFPVENITLDLNGFSIQSSASVASACVRSKVLNGALEGRVGIDFSNGCLFRNVSITVTDVDLDSQGDGAIIILDVQAKSVIFENVTVRSPVAVVTDETLGLDITFKNSELISTGDPDELGRDVAFIHDGSSTDKYTLQETNVSNYTRDFIWINDPVIPEYFLKNSALRINTTELTIVGAARIHTQHNVVINVSESSGTSVPAAIRIKENTTGGISAEESLFSLSANPTSDVLVATDENGIASVYLTEKTTVLTVASPVVTQVLSNPVYNIIARAGEASGTKTVSVVGNSTFLVNVEVSSAGGGNATLPQCTISQMLDLDNNGAVNAKDALIIIKHMVGKPITVNSTKECNALNFLPIHG